jgi:GntR family transcriptional regulator
MKQSPFCISNRPRVTSNRLRLCASHNSQEFFPTVGMWHDHPVIGLLDSNPSWKLLGKTYRTARRRHRCRRSGVTMRSKNSNGSMPAYQKIQGSIRKRIEGGELQPGDAVASERELARIHQVSLMTARHALATLEREGVVERRRGIGTFVATPKIHFNKLMSYTEQMASRGLATRSKIVYTGVLNDENEIAARLSLPPGSPLVKIERVRHAADEPFALETCYLSAEAFPGLADAPLERGSLFGTLQREHGIELAYADEEVDATASDGRVAKLLAVPRGTPLLRIRQLIYSTKGKSAIYVLGLYLSGRHTLMIRRFR